MNVFNLLYALTSSEWLGWAFVAFVIGLVSWLCIVALRGRNLPIALTDEDYIVGDLPNLPKRK